MASRPHLLLITTDQQRGDCLGLAGHPMVETPNIDALFSRGAYFPRAYAEVPSSIASRRALMAGQSQTTHGMLGYKDHERWEPAHTLPGVLAAAGYHTYFVGNMHLYPNRKLYGFHHKVMQEGGEPGFVDDYRPWFASRSNGVGPWDHGVDGNSWVARPWHLPESLHATNWTVDEAVRFMDIRDPDVPFFLWVSFTRPHPPCTPPQALFDQYIREELPGPAIGDWAEMNRVDSTGLDPNAWRGELPPRVLHRERAGYYGEITHIDYQLGRLFHEMRRRRVFNDTFVLFTSDHGEMLGDHYLFRKTYAYEGSARVPFVVRCPSGFDAPARQTSERVVGLMDVMPTLLDAAGAAIPDSVDGLSVLSLLRGRTEGWRPYLHGEHSACYGPTNVMQYLTDGCEKYVWLPALDQEQLFDLRSDPDELHDLARDPAAQPRVKVWRERLVQVLADRGDPLTDGQRLVPPAGAACSEKV